MSQGNCTPNSAASAEETPSASAAPCEVFPHDPALTFAGIPFQSPLPQSLEDGVINTAEDALATHMAVIHRPTAYDPAELCDQFPRCNSLRSPDDFPDVLQKNMDVLARWFNQQLSIAVARMLASLSSRARDEFRAFLLVRVHHEPRAATYPSWTLLDSKWLYAHLHLHDLCRGLLAGARAILSIQRLCICIWASSRKTASARSDKLDSLRFGCDSRVRYR
jgi:hypothetical protein